MPRVIGYLVYRRLAYAAPREIDYPKKRLVVVMICGEPRVCQYVLYFFSVEELETAVYLMRYAIL